MIRPLVALLLINGPPGLLMIVGTLKVGAMLHHHTITGKSRLALGPKPKIYRTGLRIPAGRPTFILQQHFPIIMSNLLLDNLTLRKIYVLD